MTTGFKRLLIAGTALTLPSQLLAQEAAPNATAADAGLATQTADGSAPDIVVTAQNRVQSVQDVPIAINVFNQEQLRDSGINDLTNLTRIAPVINITNDTVNTRIAIRGVGTLSNDEAQDQSIAINIDGEYLNRGRVLNSSLFDIQRVEVLRGPQGTLYGRNATGGAVNFITRKPGDDFGVNASAIVGNYGQITVEGGVDIPLGEVGALRIAGIYDKRKGFNFHPNANGRSGGVRNVGGRASLRLQPIEPLTIEIAGEYVNTDSVPAAQAFVNLNIAGNGPGPSCNLNGFTEVAPATPGVQCIPTNTNFLSGVNRKRYPAPGTGIGEAHDYAYALRGRVAYDFGPATLTYTGGYRDSTIEPGRTTLSPAFVTLTYGSDVKTHSHELRLNGGTEGAFVWQAGAFYFNERQTNAGQGLYLPAISRYINYFRRPFVDTESWAVFGQADLPLTETLTAVVGGRYTKDDRSARYENLAGQASPPVRLDIPATAAQTLNLGTKNSKFTWLAGLNYKPDQDTLAYAKVSTGIKAGGFDAIGDYLPETNTAYEVGAKINFGPRREHTFNASTFYYDYKNLQVSVLLDPAQGQRIFNAGKATISGIEAEAVINLDRNDSFNMSVNYLKANYDSLLASYAVFCVGCGATGVGDLDNNPATVTQPNLAGNRIPQAPKFTITAGYDHTFNFDAGDLTASVFSRFKSDYYLDIFNYRDARQTAFTQTDISLKYQPTDRRWSVQAFVRNLEDYRALTFATFLAAGQDDIFNWQFGAARTYGLRVAFDL